MTFLEKLADEIISRYKENLQNLCFVFPSRRAGIFFKKALSERLSKPAWAPEIFSIEDFIRELSPYTIPDKLVLIFELFEVYKAHGEEESFDKFYPWGEMMLKDFDEIDKNLITGSEIFKIIRELKEVETEFSLSPEDLEQFSRFWRTFSNEELTELQNEFIKTWEILGKVYNDFRKRLAEKNYAYDGMAYRKLFEEIKTGIIKIPWSKVIFAGFNLLTKSEEGIIKELLKQNTAETYWDTDEYYVNNRKQEAGEFLRRNFKNLNVEEPKWIENNLITSKKSIKVKGAPLQAGQAKALGSGLKHALLSEKINPEHTAIVLPDECMLIPVLNSLPDEITSLNVTMGFPMKDAPLYNLIELLKNLQHGKKSGKSSTVFYHKDVIRILLHPYVKFTDAAFVYDTVNDIRRNNIIYVSTHRILGEDEKHPPVFDLLFRKADTINEILQYLFDILNHISQRIEISGSAYAKFELEFFYMLYEKLNLLKDTITLYSGKMGADTFWRLLTEMLRTIHIPLTGDPLGGLQVMGLLETRGLDFENVFILSMNEGIIPKGTVMNSFIPYNIRKSFKLPTYEDEDALPAYYFYRLLQRAENIHLFYNTEVNKIYGGEISRLILQTENELIQSNPQINYSHTVVSTEIGKPFRKEITVSKTQEIIEKLKIPSFSPSDLNSYINCKLQFYLRKIARLREEETVEEFFSPATFGNILHNVVEIIYKQYEGAEITRKIIESIRKNLNNNFDDILTEAFGKIDSLKELDAELQGKNLLLKNIIKKLVNKVLDSDIRNLPFKIISLEMKFENQLKIKLNGKEHDIILKGRIDRIDEKDNTQVIIDYKTGQFSKPSGSKSSVDYNTIFTDPKYKEYFQAYFYAYNYLQREKKQSVKIAIYPLKKIDEGLVYLRDDALSLSNISDYKENLIKLAEEIFNPEICFSQTDDKERCRFCPFISICYRE
jgi:CRISPR/Cas system-associated exonuclease Cas4 (RecB family)